MSLRIRVSLSIVASLSLAFLIACGSSSKNVTPPPSGGFSNSNLNGTYVFSVSGLDLNGAPYAIVGTFTANGQGGNGTGGITAGTVDTSDVLDGATVANVQLQGGSSYTVGADGRGQAHLVTGSGTAFGTIILDFVLQDSSHGLVTEFDDTASGSGTIDIQTAGTTPNGSYAFSLSGGDVNGSSFASIGEFTLGSNGTISSGLEDYNDGGIPYSGTSSGGLALGGQVVAGPSSTPGTVLQTASFGLGFDVYPIDATHLKFIEVDGNGTLSGDAYAQTSTSMPVGTLPFTLFGALGGSSPVAAGGFLVTDSSGDITDGSSEDINEDGSTVTTPGSPVTFSGSYVASGTGRYLLNNFSGFVGGSEYVAYPSSAGAFLLEIDGLNIEAGVAYPNQSSGATFSSGQGYGMNLSGANFSAFGSFVEVDDVAEFTAASSGTISGYDDENYDGGIPTANIAFVNNSSATSTFTAPTGGRGQIGAALANLNGGFLLNYYVVDGTTFPFIELDTSGQITSGVLVEQNASSSSAQAAKASAAHLFVAKPLVRANRSKKQARKKLN